jgi:predicted RNA binding protein YcfA (HicA-like mRNA interferase family)
MSKSLQQLRNGREFIHYAETHGAQLRNGKGSHVIVSTPKGQTVVPHHNQDLGPGLRHKLVKLYIAIGLSVLTLAILACSIGSLS